MAGTSEDSDKSIVAGGETVLLSTVIAQGAEAVRCEDELI